MGGNNAARLVPIAVLIFDVMPNTNNNGTMRTSAPPPRTPPTTPTINPIIVNNNI